jgi:hypothetical protein
VIQEVPVKSAIQDGWMQQKITPNGKPTRVVSAVDGAAFSEFWLTMATSKEAGAIDGSTPQAAQPGCDRREQI